MDTLFDKSDFVLCDIPVPQGYPQSQTHCTAVLYKESVFLVTSPYPSVRLSFIRLVIRYIIRKISFGFLFKNTRGEYYENPCIYVSVASDEYPPRKFQLMQSRPLIETPDNYYGLPSFNSDPNLNIDNNQLVILNRTTYRKDDGYENRLYLIKGKDDCGRFRLDSISMFKEGQIPFVSPCIIIYKDKYLFTYLDTNCYNDGKSYDGLYMIYSDRLDDLRNNNNWNRVDVISGDYLPWHMSLFVYNSKLYSIVTCIKKGYPQRGYLMLGAFSEDLQILSIYPKPLSNYNSYRSSAFVDEKGTFVLYNATLREKIKGGRSVDGREIVVAQMPFVEVIAKVNSIEG